MPKLRWANFYVYIFLVLYFQLISSINVLHNNSADMTSNHNSTIIRRGRDINKCNICGSNKMCQWWCAGEKRPGKSFCKGLDSEGNNIQCKSNYDCLDKYCDSCDGHCTYSPPRFE